MKVLKVILSILLIIVLGIATLWFKPGLLINSKSLAYLQQRFLPDLNFPWENLNLDFKNTGLSGKEVTISLSQPSCASYPPSEVCLEEFYLKVRYNLTDTYSVEFKKLRLISPQSHIQLPEPKKNSQSEPLFVHDNLKMLKQYLGQFLQLRRHDFSIRISNSKIVSNDKVYNIALDLTSSDLLAEVEAKSVKLRIENHLSNLESLPFGLNGEALATMNNSAFSLQWEGKIDDRLHLGVQVSDRGANKDRPNFKKAEIDFTLKTEPDTSQLVIQSLDFRPRFGFDAVLSRNCKVEFTTDREKTTEFNCPEVTLQNTNWKKKIKFKSLRKEFPTEFQFQASGFLNEYVFGSGNREKLSEVKVNLVPIDHRHFMARFRTAVELYAEKNKISWDIVELKSLVKLRQFQHLVMALKESRYAIPAPLNTLNGPLRFSLQEVQGIKKPMTLQGKGNINLRGRGNQRLATKVDLKIELSDEPEKTPNFFGADVNIQDISFHLPPFDPLKGLPPLTADGRIKEEPKPKEKKSGEKSNWDYRIKVGCERPDSIRIYYKLFDPYLAGSLKAELAPEAMGYEFSLHNSFKISYLRRQLTIQKINIDHPKSQSGKTNLDLRALYQAAGYDVFLDVIGTLGRPQLQLSSRPNLPRNDIISVLLYNRPRGQLSRTQNRNVGGTEAAIADRAIGLIGIWAFASTPIESVSYNPQTQTYEAHISLPGQFNLSVGTDWEQNQYVGLQRRISENWFLVTGYEVGDEDNIGNFYLQREFSY